MKKILLTGLATFLPIAITLFIFVFVIDLLTAPFIDLTESFITGFDPSFASNHTYLLLFVSRFVILILLFFVVFILGMLGRRLLFSWIIKLVNRIFKKIPIVKTIYRITQDVTNNVFKGDNTQLFQGTVSVPFPHEKCHAFGFLSTSAPKEAQEKTGDNTLHSVFVPTAPHPISGFLVMYSETEINKIDISSEDLIKLFLSCGMTLPKEKEEPK